MERTIKVGKLFTATVAAAALSATMMGLAGIDTAQAKTSAPAKTSVSKVTSTKAGKITVKVKKIKKVTGYRIQVAKDKNFKKIAKTKKTKKTTYTFSGLTQGKKYYVRACTYVKKGGKYTYSKWSGKSSVTVYKTPSKSTGEQAATEPSVPESDSRNNGTIDTSKAAIGESTPGLATIEEATSQNQLTFTDEELAANKSARTISQDTFSYLHTTDFGKSVDLQIEMLTPSDAKAGETPLFVWINGGGFTSSDAAKNLETRLTYAKAGYVVASVQHGVSAANSTWPTALRQIKLAIRTLKANSTTYKFDKSKVAVAGNSSGGYFASMVGVTGNTKTIQYPNARSGKMEDVNLDGLGGYQDESSAVNAVIDYYGVSDLTVIGAGLSEELQNGHRSAATTEALLLNGAAAAQKGVGVFDESMNAKVAAASPFTYIDADDPEFLFLHGTADTLVSPVATKMLQNRLEDEGVYTERYVFNGAGHGGNAFLQESTNEKCLAFLEKCASDSIVASEGAVDTAKGTEAYKAEDLPTFEQAIAGGEDVAVDSDKWNISQVKEISYKVSKGNDTYTTLKMNLLIPSKTSDKSPRPVLYCAACGGFNKSNYNAMSYLRYAEQGYIVAIAEIRVVPSVTMPTPVQDAKAGIRWLRAHATDYNIDKDCFIVTGTSAGGYFSAMLGVLGNTTQFSDDVKFDVGENLDQSSAVQGVVDFYGVSDLTIIGAGLPNYDVHDSESNTEALLVNGTAFGRNSGSSVFGTLEKDAMYSPFTYVDKDDAKFLLLHGDEHDTSVSPVATYELYKRIVAAGGSAERYTLVGAGHGTKEYFQSEKVYKIVDDFMADIVAASK